MAEYSLKDVAEMLGVDSPSEEKVVGYAIDSRLVRKGDLFFALPGERVDGHDFINQVREKGAVGAVVSEEVDCPGFPLIRVKDTTEALQQLAHKVLKAHPDVKVVGVTGTVGKTSTKEFLATLLEGKFRVGRSPGSYNSQLSLPLTVLSQPLHQIDCLVLEMAMSEKGNLTRLVEVAPPEAALITHISLVHSEFFDSLEEIALAKAEIFSSRKTKVKVLPKEQEYLARGGITFSSHADADYQLISCDPFLVLEKGKEVHLPSISLPGVHHYQNLVGAMAVARQLGLSWEEIGTQVPKLKLPEGRWRVVERNGVTLIDDAYNASPASVKAALDAMPEGGRKVAVLGSMKELGKFSNDSHKEISKYAAAKVDRLILYGDEMQVGAGESACWTDQWDSLVTALQKELQKGDTVLIKGSNSLQMWKLIDCL